LVARAARNLSAAGRTDLVIPPNPRLRGAVTSS